MADLEIIALDTLTQDADGRYLLRAPKSGDAYIANRPVNLKDGFTVNSDDLVLQLNADYLRGKTPADFVTQAELDAVLPGLAGADGKDGQIRFTGHGLPGTIIGASPDDTYLDLDTGNVYKLG